MVQSQFIYGILRSGFPFDAVVGRARRAIGHCGQCPPPRKNKSKEETVQLSYNSEKDIQILPCFARHSGARDSVIYHFVDLSLVHKH